MNNMKALLFIAIAIANIGWLYFTGFYGLPYALFVLIVVLLIVVAHH